MTFNFGVNRNQERIPRAGSKTGFSFGIKKEPKEEPKITLRPGEKVGDITRRTLPAFLGRGSYNIKVGDPSYLHKEEKGFGEVETKRGFQRAHIFPTSLGGTNERKNITHERFLPEVAEQQARGEQLPIIQTATDRYLIEEILPKYRKGEMSLREAQVKVVSHLRNEQEGLNKAMKNINLGGQAGAFADDFMGTARRIRRFFGDKVGMIANNIVRKNTPPMRFEVGAGLNENQAQTARAVVDDNIAKGAEEKKHLPVRDRIVSGFQRVSDQIRQEKAIDKTLTRDQRHQRENPYFKLRAKTASELLGEEIKPENYLERIKTLTPEQRGLIEAESKAKEAEAFAKVATAPVRFFAGYPAAAIVSAALEFADEDASIDPKTMTGPKGDMMRLLIGNTEVKRLLESDDVYGILARSAGLPATISLIALLENPFVARTGAGTIAKGLIRGMIKRQGADQVAKMGLEEFIKITDKAIRAEQKAGRISQEVADRAIKEITPDAKTPITPPTQAPLRPPVKPKTAPGDAITKKTDIIPPKTPQGIVEPRVEPKINKKPISKDYTKSNVKKTNIPTIHRGKDVGANKERVPKITDKLPKKPSKTEPIKYEPIEKAPDTRRRVVVKKITADAAIPKRIQADAIERGLIDSFRGLEEYEKLNLKDQAKRVANLINEEPERAVRIALGREIPKASDNTTPEAVLIAVKNQAIKDGNTDLVVRLATEEGGVAREATYLGQRIKSLDENISDDDAFKKIREVIRQRDEALEVKTRYKVKDLKNKEVKNIKDIIVKAKPKKDEWLDFVESIRC